MNMAVYRQLQVKFWQDDFSLELTPEEKYFYIYLMLNSKTTQCGIFKLHRKIMEVETGYNGDTVDKLLKRFVDYGKIHYCQETKEIMVANWIKYNFINSKNTILCINKELKEVKNQDFIIEFYKLCRKYEYPINEIFKGFNMEKLCEKQSLDLDKNKYKKLGEEGGESVESKENSMINQDINPLKEVDKDMNFHEEVSLSEELCPNVDKKMASLNEEYELIEDEASIDTSRFSILEENTEYERKISSSGLDNRGKEDEISFKDVVEAFNNNIHFVTPMEYEELKTWEDEMPYEVLILAIKEEAFHNARTLKYINSILINWQTLGLSSLKDVENYQSKWQDKRSKNKITEGEAFSINGDAYKCIE